MKIYISTDLEGVTGVFHFGQTREQGSPANQEACRMLMHDVAAVAARVIHERGATYVLLGAPSARRGLGRLSEPLPARLLRLAPEADLRIVADRGR